MNFAFVFFHPTTFEIVPMDKNAGTLLNRFTKLKEKKPGLQTWVSVGGWSFNDRMCKIVSRQCRFTDMFSVQLVLINKLSVTWPVRLRTERLSFAT